MQLFLAAMASDQNFNGFAQEICPEVRRQQYTKWCFDVETAATYTSSIVSMTMLMLIPPWCALSGITNHDQFSSWDFEVNPKSNAPQVKIKFWSARGMDRLPECFKAAQDFLSISSP